MLEDNKRKILDNPKVLREEIAREPAKKPKAWVFKIILILVIIGLILYLFMHPEGIQNWVNKVLENLLR